MVSIAHLSNAVGPSAPSAEPRILEVMTPAPHTIGSDQPLELARRIMQEKGLRHLPVLRAGQLIGLITQRDLLLIDRVGREMDTGSVAEAMTLDIYTARPDEMLRDVARVMYMQGYTCAAVVDGGRLLGVFTTSDALRHVAQIR